MTTKPTLGDSRPSTRTRRLAAGAAELVARLHPAARRRRPLPR